MYQRVEQMVGKSELMFKPALSLITRSGKRNNPQPIPVRKKTLLHGWYETQ
jgi:hypothetical protein